LRNHFGWTPGASAPLAGKRLALWGLAFKAETDDIRESMALELIDNLVSQGAEMVVHDFEAMPAVKAKLGSRVQYAADPMAACEGCDALIIATEWAQYRAADLEVVAKKLKAKVLFDGRNLFRPEAMQRSGWVYHSIGRLPVAP